MAVHDISAKKEAIYRSLAKGRQKIHGFLIQQDPEDVRTWEESCAMLEFLKVSCKKEYDLKRTGEEDVRIDELFPEHHVPSFAQKLREVAGAETVGDLLRASGPMVRMALAGESACLTDVILSMMPHASAMTYAEFVDYLEHTEGNTLM